jgi:predicted N-acetyltransferase YhbS
MMTVTPLPLHPPAELAVRPLSPVDLDGVVAIDAQSRGSTRREYIERRLRAAQRQPSAHAQFGAFDADGLAGYILARTAAGEFGRSRPALRLELLGVRGGRHRAGIGRHHRDRPDHDGVSAGQGATG